LGHIDMAMDHKRDPAILRRKKIRRGIFLGVATIGIIAISVAVSRLEPAAPSIPRATIWPDTVKRGPMVREVRGAGLLVPEEIRWIPAMASGRVERIVLRPGARVEPGTVIIELSNPDLEQSVRNAEVNWRTAEAQLADRKSSLETGKLSAELAVADARSSHALAVSDLDANKALNEQGLVAASLIRQKQATVDQARNRLELVQKQLDSVAQNERAQIAPAEANVSQTKAEFERLSRQRDDLKVKSTMSGQLQLVQAEEGAQISLNANVARVSNPTRLKAEIRISETQTRDLAIGQIADVDTRNGHVKGRVSRIDPASQGGTVGVDITLEGPLPAGARPDLSVDGTIELERLQNVLYVQSPAFGQENSTISLFKILPSGDAIRTPVKLGRRSVQFVEVVEGLQQGDEVILSDMSQYDGFDRVQVVN
jgi:HlyD family secretion protein